MSAAAFMRAAKLKGAGIIRMAARHNLREIQAEHGASGPIDATRCHLNQVLEGASTAAGVDQYAKALMEAAGVTAVRKDAVMAIELVMSLPVASTVSTQRYFDDCLSWVKGYFNCPVLSAVVHLDEAAPHCHVLLLPLKDGRMAGNKLIGGRPQLMAMQNSFHESVAGKHGLRKAPARLTGASKKSAAAMVLARLKETGDSAMASSVWAAIRGCIEGGPERFLEALGLVAQPKVKAPRTMAQIFTSPGKGPKREVPQLANAIAFDTPTEGTKAIAFKTTENGAKSDPLNAIAFAKPAQEKHEGYVSVAFAKSPTLLPSTNGSRSATAWHGHCRHLTTKPVGLFTSLILSATPSSSGDDLSHLTTTRVKDDEHSAGAWDAERGEFSEVAIPTTDSWAANHVAAIRSKTRAPSIATESGDRFVERDVDVSNQSEISEGEVQAWH